LVKVKEIVRDNLSANRQRLRP